MKSIKILIMFLLLVGFTLITSCHQNNKGFSPNIKGYSLKKLDSLKTFLDEKGASSMLVIVDGDVIFEWGNTSKKHLIHSMRKPLIHSLIGIAIAEKKLDTSMTMKHLGITDSAPKLSELELSARVADLLKSKSGVYHLSAAMTKNMKTYLPKRNTHQPGSNYFYNNWDFNTLGGILEQQTGKKIHNLFKTQIAEPLGMKDYKGVFKDIDWETEKKPDISELDGYYKYEKSKSQYPAYHFRMSTRDMARFGQLYLNNGVWNGKQLIPKDWIEVSTKAYSIYNPEKRIGYGMLWRIQLAENNKDVVSFFHTGMGRHTLAIYPDKKMVIVHRVDTEKDFNYKKENLEKTLELFFNSKIELNL